MKNIFIFCQPNTFLDDSKSVYGALRATIEIASYLKTTNLYNVCLFAKRVNKNDFFGIPCREESSYALLRDVSKNETEAVIGISRGDCFKSGDFNLVYHHGPHQVLGLDPACYDKKISLLICVSKFSLTQQVEYGINPKKIRIVSNGIDPELFYPHSIHRLPKTYLFAGQIRGYKGIANLLEAFFLALSSDPDLKLDVCGENMTWAESDPGYDWIVKNNLLSRDNKIDWKNLSQTTPQISYLGEKSKKEMALEYSRHSFLVCSSVVPETFGLVSLEAQACGCIPIIADHGGYLETLVRGCPKLTYNTFDRVSLAEEIIKSSNIIYSEFLRQKISSAARLRSWRLAGKKFLIEVNRRKKNPLLFLCVQVWKALRQCLSSY